MSDSDDRNGGRPSMHPEAVEALATEIANKQAADERWIQRVDDSVKEMKDGTTEWQKSVTRALQQLTDQVQILMVARFIWPTVTIGSLLFLGAFAAELVWRLSTHH